MAFFASEWNMLLSTIMKFNVALNCVVRSLYFLVCSCGKSMPMPPRVWGSYICLLVLFLLIFLALRGTDHPPYPIWFETYCVYVGSRLYIYIYIYIYILVLSRLSRGIWFGNRLSFPPFLFYFCYNDKSLKDIFFLF